MSRRRRLLRLLVDAVNEHHGAVNDDDLVTLDVEEHPVLVLVEGRPHLAQSPLSLPTSGRPGSSGPTGDEVADIDSDPLAATTLVESPRRTPAV
jgi:hypothetical protein